MLAAPLFAGSLALEIGNPSANPEAMAKHAVLVARMTACTSPEKTIVAATAEGIVDGVLKSIPLKIVALPTVGTYAVAREWPAQGNWAVRMIATNPDYKDYTASVLVPVGDRVAFGALYEQYGRLVHGILLAHVPYHEAEDLMQDVFVKALERLPELREAAAFRAWLLAIARHTATDHQRRKKPAEPFLAAKSARPRGDAFAVLDTIQRLPECYRETLILRLVEGMTGPEIAERTGLTADSVRVNLCRRMKLLRARDGEHRLALDHGTIHALIWAPPAEFVVDTPAAKTVDLGCRYTLRVAPDGVGFLTVEMGWVAFEWKNLESFIPAGAACTTRPGRGPDTPHFLDAPETLINAGARFDRAQDPQALRAALEAARPRDALMLWHLLERTRGEERAEVFERFAMLVKLPPGLGREAILS